MKRPFVLGLTGSIGMGKSATAALFVKHGVPVHDSDAAVHVIYDGRGTTSREIAEAFPGSARDDGSIDRTRLRAMVLDDTTSLKRLESMIHPRVQAESNAFIKRNEQSPLVVLDIPLLFETGAEERCDAVLVVTAPASVQRDRVLAREGMTEATLDRILAKQMPDTEKRKRADFIIDTSQGFAHAEAKVMALIARLSGRSDASPT